MNTLPIKGHIPAPVGPAAQGPGPQPGATEQPGDAYIGTAATFSTTRIPPPSPSKLAANLASVGTATTTQAAARTGFGPCVLDLSKVLGIEFRAKQRGLDFWRTHWRPVSAERAIELAGLHKPLVMRTGKDWRSVGDLDTFQLLLAEQEHEVTRRCLERASGAVGEKVAEAITGCPFHAALKSGQSVPEVRVRSLVGSAWRHSDSPMDVLRELHAKYGEVFTMDLPTKGHFQFDNRPEVLRAALCNTDAGSRTFSKSEIQGHGAAFLIGKQNMFLSGGQDWETVHSVLMNQLGAGNIHNDAMAGRLLDIFDEHLDGIQREIEKSPNGEAQIDIRRAMQGPVLDVAMQVLLGTKLSRDELSALQDAFTTQISWIRWETVNPTDVSLSKLPGVGHLKDAYDTVNRVADRVIAERRKTGVPGDDMLGSLLKIRDQETGQPLSDERLRHEVISLMEAGHETTGSLMSWALLMLGRQPEEYEKLRKEVDSTVGQGRPTAKQLEKLKSTDHIIKEALRMYPPFYLFMRTANSDVTVQTPDGTATIPRGTTLVSNLYTPNRDEKMWGKAATGFPANEFHPDRWIKKLPLPMNFGGGRRICVGMLLGKMEAELMLTRFAQKFDISAVHEKPPELASDLSLHPADGTVKVRLRQKP